VAGALARVSVLFSGASAASAVSMFEPMGGSAPKYTGKNVINPLATICAGGMMMDTLGEPKIAQAIDKAVHQPAVACRQSSIMQAAACARPATGYTYARRQPETRP